MPTELTAEQIVALGYFMPRKLPTGEWAALQKMLYTTGLFIVTDEYSWRTRWCYEHAADALMALAEWDGKGDPPGPWVKEKPSDRLNPHWAKS